MPDTTFDKEKYAKKIVENTRIYSHREESKDHRIEKRDLKVSQVELGDFATIRSVHDEDGDDIMIGIFVGTVRLLMFDNPIFYVPKLKRCLAGIESWWRPIPKKDYDMSCEAMKTKYGFTWDEIEQVCKKLFNSLRSNK